MCGGCAWVGWCKYIPSLHLPVRSDLLIAVSKPVYQTIKSEAVGTKGELKRDFIFLDNW